MLVFRLLSGYCLDFVNNKVYNNNVGTRIIHEMFAL